MFNLVKELSDTQYRFRTAFLYPYPTNGQYRAILDSEIKRATRESKIKDYKILSGLKETTIFFKTKDQNTLFQKTFNQVISKHSVDAYFSNDTTGLYITPSARTNRTYSPK